MYMYNAIITDMAQFDVKHNCEFLVCGDFNSRTASLPDYVLNDNSSHIPLPDDHIADDQIKMLFQGIILIRWLTTMAKIDRRVQNV